MMCQCWDEKHKLAAKSSTDVVEQGVVLIEVQDAQVNFPLRCLLLMPDGLSAADVTLHFDVCCQMAIALGQC